MKGGFLIIVGLLIICLGVELVAAAPSIEACPKDSELVDDGCVCDLNTCKKPPCLTNLTIASKGTNEPGSCCPRYSCDGCKEDAMLEGKCPCAPGAIINHLGVCECLDKQHHLVDGKCVCNPQQCKLPEICDSKSVPTTVQDGCCTTTTCVACPQDSEPTNLETDELEDHCVCLPCVSDCGYKQKVVVIKNGTGLPGHCCDLYVCQPLVGLAEQENNGETDCFVGDIIYENGSRWSTDDKQFCTCKNGLSLCEPKFDEQPLQNCIDDAVMYKHNETWRKDHNCTFCTCLNGESKCITHYCDVKESHIKENGTASCLKDGKTFKHEETWTDEDNKCTVCVCLNGEISCDPKSCEWNKWPKPGECQPLIKCNKQCSNGFRISKKGCEICKCNPSKVSVELLTKYNITYNDLLNILEDYSRRRTSTGDSSEISTVTPTATKTTPMQTVVLIRRNGNHDEGTTSPETMITTTFLPKEDSPCWVIVSVVAVAILVLVTLAALLYCCKNKRKYNVSESRGNYHSVLSSTNNNNITKKSGFDIE